MKEGRERAASTGGNFYQEGTAASSAELEEKRVHLQTVLLLTQLNSAYFEMTLSLQKAFKALELKYTLAKMNGFFSLKAYKRNKFQAQSSLSIFMRNSGLMEGSEGKGHIRGKAPQCLVLQDEQGRRSRTLLKTAYILRRLGTRIDRKKMAAISTAFHRILNYHKDSTLKIYSRVQSRQNPSRERREHRRLYSLQKSKAIQKAEQKMPQQPSLSTNERSDSTGKGSQLSKLLQKNMEEGKRRNGREGPLMRSKPRRKEDDSPRKDRQQKIKQLQFLKQKYSKLVRQFNNFSEKFLSVIESDDGRRLLQ